MNFGIQRQWAVERPPVGRTDQDGVNSDIARNRLLSWALRQKRHAASGLGLGILGGVGWMLGTIVLGLGLGGGSSAPIADGTLTPYLIGASIALMIGWLLWTARPAGFKPLALVRVAMRQGLVLGGVYGATLAAMTGLGALV